MIKIRKSQDRGHFNHGWLNTYHTFSFADYQDPNHKGFRALRVINEDWVKPGEGFGTHSHHDMELLTYVLEGALEHKDSMGNTSVIKPGELQRMSAGTGVTHSEFNPSKEGEVHLLQIWIRPKKKGIEPEYEQKKFSENEKRNQLRLIASSDGRHHSLTIHQDADLYDLTLEAGKEFVYEIPPGRHIWIQLVQGKIRVNGEALDMGDGAAVSANKKIRILALEEASILLFDLC